MYTKVIILKTGAEAKVYHEEASALISKGLACLPCDYKQWQPEEYQNKAIESAPKNKRKRK